MERVSAQHIGRVAIPVTAGIGDAAVGIGCLRIAGEEIVAIGFHFAARDDTAPARDDTLAGGLIDSAGDIATRPDRQIVRGDRQVVNGAAGIDARPAIGHDIGDDRLRHCIVRGNVAPHGDQDIAARAARADRRGALFQHRVPRGGNVHAACNHRISDRIVRRHLAAIPFPA